MPLSLEAETAAEAVCRRPTLRLETAGNLPTDGNDPYPAFTSSCRPRHSQTFWRTAFGKRYDGPAQIRVNRLETRNHVFG